MDITYFQKINNTYNSKSKQETDLYLLNRQIDNNFDGNIDYHVVKRNGEPFELIIVKDTDGNTFKKKIKSKNSQPFNLGDYIYVLYLYVGRTQRARLLRDLRTVRTLQNIPLVLQAITFLLLVIINTA